MTFHTLKNITPLTDQILLAEFHDGTIRHYDVKPLKSKLPVFGMLDLSSEEIYENGY